MGTSLIKTSCFRSLGDQMTGGGSQASHNPLWDLLSLGTFLTLPSPEHLTYLFALCPPSHLAGRYVILLHCTAGRESERSTTVTGRGRFSVHHAPTLSWRASVYHHRGTKCDTWCSPCRGTNDGGRVRTCKAKQRQQVWTCLFLLY